ncbi:MAG TPA: DNA-processing protein DprA [Jiangellaceae bacterium]|nr:DNA-processing protein DprA [Jiangellaceae bacterium]
MTGRVDGERAARALLSAAVEPPGEGVARYLVAHGPEATVAALRAGSAGTIDRDHRIQRRLGGVEAGAVLRAGTECGARFVCPGEAEWPPALDELLLGVDTAPRWVAPPPGLWIRGDADLTELTGRSVAVIGARAATEYGNRTAAELAAELSSGGWTVVSGAAYGIDGYAHRGALAVGTPTVAVLACGVDRSYPQGHADLLARVLNDGLVVSELPPGTRPSRQRFLARNRLIAAVTKGTVVVEAAVRSGALNTAQWAADLGRPVAAVPGPVTSAMSGGCHKLIREGAAVLVTDAAEVADAVGEFGVDAAPQKRGPDHPLDRLGPVARDVYEAMPARRVVTADQICHETGLSIPACVAALGELATDGFVRRTDGGWRLTGRGQRG